ncbi:hypothetical protein T08_8259 [Trichinella sp. T8]|nr:hypothetical protein T08_8259 [Trichinella sp. T8]
MVLKSGITVEHVPVAVAQKYSNTESKVRQQFRYSQGIANRAQNGDNCQSLKQRHHLVRATYWVNCVERSVLGECWHEEQRGSSMAAQPKDFLNKKTPKKYKKKGTTKHHSFNFETLCETSPTPRQRKMQNLPHSTAQVKGNVSCCAKAAGRHSSPPHNQGERNNRVPPTSSAE